MKILEPFQEDLQSLKNLQDTLNLLKNLDYKDISPEIVNIDLLNIQKEEAEYLVFLNQNYTSVSSLLIFLPENFQAALYELYRQIKFYMDILPKIANDEVTEAEIEHYLLRQALDFRRKKELQYLADSLEKYEA
ncbi:MAG: hypothetical protein MUE85_01430 [Microscillaceae bacterium]|jgi:hypothetical protein|nr:hypothetical protein [Microscillaceae bacterium]